nr:fimbrial protein [Serratia odorifera]
MTVLPREVNLDSTYVNSSYAVGIALYKTGPTGSGAITTGRVGRVGYKGIRWITSINVSGGTIKTVACSLNASNIQVPLGDVLATEFTGVGTTLKPKAFNVGLACDANAKINVSLGGTQSAESSDSSILQLTNAGSDGVAKGVGVQLLYNNTPLKLNQLLALKTSAGGQETFPFTAHYYQTAANITAGSANATATLNISYQ